MNSYENISEKAPVSTEQPLLAVGIGRAMICGWDQSITGTLQDMLGETGVFIPRREPAISYISATKLANRGNLDLTSYTDKESISAQIRAYVFILKNQTSLGPTANNEAEIRPNRIQINSDPRQAKRYSLSLVVDDKNDNFYRGGLLLRGEKEEIEKSIYDRTLGSSSKKPQAKIKLGSINMSAGQRIPKTELLDSLHSSLPDIITLGPVDAVKY